MDLENIRYELRPPIAVVTVDRPKVLNALNLLSMTELEQVFLDIRQNADDPRRSAYRSGREGLRRRRRHRGTGYAFSARRRAGR